MITLFSTPKDFIGIFKIIQTNALRSWRHLSPDIQIIIMGDSQGSYEMAEEIGAEFIPNIQCSKEGTPLLSDLFRQAQKKARFSIMTFINADIILPVNFLNAVNIAAKRFNQFLLIGHRWDMDVNTVVDFQDSQAANHFWESAANKSQKHPCTGIDYFVFNKGLWKSLPDFIIGRPGYDNWLIWNIRRRLLPVIDASEIINAVHQNHDYNFHNVKNRKGRDTGNETKVNIKLHKGKLLNILDANYQISEGEIHKKKSHEFTIRNLYRLPKIFPEISILIKLYRRVYIRFFNKKK